MLKAKKNTSHALYMFPLVVRVCCILKGSFDKEIDTPRVCCTSKGRASTWRYEQVLALYYYSLVFHYVALGEEVLTKKELP